MKKSIVVLQTDFGHRDPFVGVMKGVILSNAPKAVLVDLCHEVPPQDVRTAAFQLMTSSPYFPDGSLFVCVVDPGVGSARRVLLARTRRHRFLAPDNGLLSWLPDPILEVRAVENEGPFLRPVSATFHGRDVFAPLAATLANGVAPARLGPRTRRWAKLAFPSRGEILAIDRFGNAVTSVRRARRVRFRGKGLPVLSHYGATRAGAPLAVRGSAGFIELSVRDGDFARRFKAAVGDRVQADG